MPLMTPGVCQKNIAESCPEAQITLPDCNSFYLNKNLKQMKLLNYKFSLKLGMLSL